MDVCRKTLLNKIVIFIIVALMIILQMVPAFAADSSDKKIVRVACGINNALYLNENGSPEGYCVDYVQQLEWDNNWKLEYVEGDWTESVNNLESGKVDILLPTQKTDERMNTMLFSNHICGYQKIVLYAKDGAKIYYNDYKAFDGKRIAMTKNTSNKDELDKFAKEHNFTYKAVYMDSAEAKVKALKSGKVDLIDFSSLNDVEGGKVVAVLNSLPFYVCTSISNPELMDEINKGTNKIMASNPDIMSNMFSDVLSGTTDISFTRGEVEKIAETKTIRIGVPKDTLPLSGVDSKGKTVGIYVDLLNEISNKSGLKFDIVPIDRSKLIYEVLRAGDVDFVIGSSKLPLTCDDVSDFLISNWITDYTTVAITRPDYEFDKEEKPEFAITKARKYLKKFIESKYPKATIKYLQTSKDCLKAVQDGSADVTMINTWEYNYQTKNSRFSDLTEWENMRQTAGLVIGATNKSDLEVLSILEKTISQITSSRTEEIITSNLNMSYDSYDGSDRWYKLKEYFPIYGSILLVLILILVGYIHIRKKNERALVEKNRELENANKAKSDFLSRMSHELRTPLNSMCGYANIMRDNLNGEELDRESMLQNITNSERATKYLLSIISDILDIQTIEAGRTAITLEEVDTDSYMQNVLDIVKQEADRRGVTFQFSRTTRLNQRYIMDGIHLQQILLNILHNAVKFTPEGGTVSLVSSGVKRNDEIVDITFVVKDTGIGMSQDFIDNRLFQKFAQENTGIDSPYEGCGTGLAISKQLLELMDGTITCESEKNVGTTFTVTIPVKIIEEKKSRRARKNIVNYDLKGISVLLFEDNPMNQDMERRILEKMNCKVDIADDGVIGLSKFDESEMNYYDIVLMDIRMPNMDGLEATRKIRALPREDAKIIPILAVSANAFETDIKDSIEAGMNEHLSKPVDARILYEKISQYCNVNEEKGE